MNTQSQVRPIAIQLQQHTPQADERERMQNRITVLEFMMQAICESISELDPGMYNANQNASKLLESNGGLDAKRFARTQMEYEKNAH